MAQFKYLTINRTTDKVAVNWTRLHLSGTTRNIV
jgi:hypothetical protein